ncbi:hypothetical protein Pmani_009266 [Petrolisthes manimaculis]|uniref:Uncharacterized protein n=1 Tax=Petrolisthes manimaculis TaxID=1843537 RepID=A0AAE1Q3W9_9EUCA|nr:hypothetical protein Pmani_009266 [Petrolisthes manimaculis]
MMRGDVEGGKGGECGGGVVKREGIEGSVEGRRGEWRRGDEEGEKGGMMKRERKKGNLECQYMVGVERQEERDCGM